MTLREFILEASGESRDQGNEASEKNFIKEQMKKFNERTERDAPLKTKDRKEKLARFSYANSALANSYGLYKSRETEKNRIPNIQKTAKKDLMDIYGYTLKEVEKLRGYEIT